MFLDKVDIFKHQKQKKKVERKIMEEMDIKRIALGRKFGKKFKTFKVLQR
jgi:hypothetical protein